MAQKKITELIEATSIDPNAVIPFDSGTQTFKMRAVDLANALQTIIPGVPRWSTTITYDLNDVVNKDGLLYISIAAANVGNAVTDPLKWKPHNPMTSVGDLIQGGIGGVPSRIPIGPANKVLRSNGTSASWEDDFATPLLPGRVSVGDQNFKGRKSFDDGGAIKGGTIAPPTGYIGESIVSTINGGVAAAASNVYSNLTSIVLTPGRWLINGCIYRSAGTTMTAMMAGHSTMSAALNVPGVDYSTFEDPTGIKNMTLTFPPIVVAVATNTTYYAVYRCTFTGTAGNAFGSISAVRLS